MASRLTVKISEKDLGWHGIVRSALSVNGATVAAGFVNDKARQVHQDGALTIAEIGAIHEFGAPGANIPERSFIRSTFDRNHGKYDAVLHGLAVAVYSGRAKPVSALQLAGATMASDIKATIRAGIPPPLAAATIARRSKKKRDRETPLLDTRQMINAISYVVDLPARAKADMGEYLLMEKSVTNAAMQAAGLQRWSDSLSLQSFSDSFAPPSIGSLRAWSDSFPVR